MTAFPWAGEQARREGSLHPEGFLMPTCPKGVQREALVTLPLLQPAEGPRGVWQASPQRGRLEGANSPAGRPGPRGGLPSSVW
jgi:hypothetical protein